MSKKKFFVDIETGEKIYANKNQRIGTLCNAGLALSYQPYHDGGLIISAGKASAEGVKAVRIATYNKVITTLKKIDKGLKFYEVYNDLSNHRINFTCSRPATIAISAPDSITTESKCHKLKNGQIIWNNRFCFKKNKSAEALEFKKLSFSVSYKTWIEQTKTFVEFIENLDEDTRTKIEKSMNGYIAETFFYNTFEDWFNHFKKAEKAKTGGDIDAWIGIQPIQIKCSLQNDPEYGFFCKNSNGTSKSNGFGPQLDFLFGFNFEEIAKRLGVTA